MKTKWVFVNLSILALAIIDRLNTIAREGIDPHPLPPSPFPQGCLWHREKGNVSWLSLSLIERDYRVRVFMATA